MPQRRTDQIRYPKRAARRFICAAVIAVLVASFRPEVCSAEGGNFASLKKQYMKLRNTDVDFRRREEWEDLSRSFIRYAEKAPPGEAASALYNAALLNEALYGRFEERDLLDECLSLLRDLVDRFPKSQLADDALLRQGEILHSRAHRDDRAREIFRRVIEEYPDSELVVVARARLSGSPASADQPPSRSDTLRGPKVVLDPGHGGEDFGAVGVSDLMEKDVVLDVALRARDLLSARGYRVTLTRTGDVFVPLEQRTRIANQAEAAVFVSLHVNASPSGTVHGLETYYLDNTGDQASQRLAERENASGSGMPPGDLAMVLSDLIQATKLPDSVILSEKLHAALFGSTKPLYPTARSLGVKKAPFYVLVGAHMPAALLEMYFINYPEEGIRLGDPLFRAALAKGLASGIEQFFAR